MEPHKVRAASLRSSMLILPDGRTCSLNISLVDAFDLVTVAAASKHSKSAQKPKARRARLVFRVSEASEIPAGASADPVLSADTRLVEIPAGARIRLVLLSQLSGKANHEGDLVEASLFEPVQLPGNAEIPAGARIQGHVVQSRPARRLRRGGKLHIAFSRLVLSTGATKEISGSLTEMELPKEEHVTLSNEGTASGGPVGLKSTLADVAVSYALGKLSDDLVEEGIKGVIGATGSAAAATAARYVGLGAGLGWFLAHRGREAVLPRYSEIEVTLNRPVKLQLPVCDTRFPEFAPLYEADPAVGR